MRSHIHPYRLIILLTAWLLCGLKTVSHAQSFTFEPREFSKKKHADAMHLATTTIVDTAYNSDDWNVLTNGTWKGAHKFKSVRSFVKLYIDHSYPRKIHSPYMYKLCYELKGYADSLASPTTINDTLVISYNPDSLTAYQDRQERSYWGFQKIVVTVTALFDITDPMNPALITMSSPSFTNRNFILESTVLVQKYQKSQYGGVVPVTTASASNGKLNINIYAPSFNTPPVPCNYELEWLYVDNYDSSNATKSAGQLQYDFRNNSTRVWLTEPSYSIPIIYQDGFIVYRARFVRPDSVHYRYPIYSKWSVVADKGTVSSADYHDIQPHEQDKFNWQYTVSFAEQGKYKQVLSYYDGLLKNRQTITRFNSLPNKLLVTENTYDYEGRPSIKTLPAPVTTPYFEFQDDVSLNFNSGLPYKASDFDSKATYNCPSEVMPAPFSNSALASIYYSKYNTDTVDYQKYVPDANGYPFVQTIYSPGYNDRIEKQGGAGDSLQIGTKHFTSYDYVGADQLDLNRLMGTDAGWSSFYNKTVTEDPNGQLSMTVKDYKGKLVHTSMIGNVNYLKHAFDSDSMGPGVSYFEQDLIGNNPQQIIGNQRRLDHNFFMDFAGVNYLQYIYSFKPYKTFCTNKYLSIASAYKYELFDQCGDQKLAHEDTLGVNGVVDSTVQSYPGSKIGVYLEKGKHSVHKELTVDLNNIYAAVDSFMALPDNCLRGVHSFIKEEVMEREYPCPNAETKNDPCTIKKKRMMEDLKPGGKYGGYWYWTDPNGVSVLTGTGYYEPNGMGNRDNNKSVFDRDENYNYRYQDTCIVNLPSYLRTMTADQFLNAYTSQLSDMIAEALLPLHPEYCRSESCFIDTFKEKYLDIPDAKTAEALGLLYIDSIIAKDPIRQKLITELAFASPEDSLNSFKGGKIFFDTLITTLAYCNCTDSIMFQTCKNDIFKSEIQSLTLANDHVKEQYFQNMKQLYFQNRERFKNYMIAAVSDSCGPCFVHRIKLSPPAHFTTYFTANGQLDTSSQSSFWASFLNDTSSTGSFADDIDSFLNMAVYMSEDSINLYNQSANQTYNQVDSLLAVGQADSITARLINCYGTDNTKMTGIKNYLKNLYSLGEVHFGNYSPAQIRAAILSQSLSLNDLCNPYLVNYSDFILTKPGTNLHCKQDIYYYSLRAFLDGVVNSGTLSSFTATTLNLSPTGDFDNEVKSRLGGASTVNIKGQYDSYGDLYTVNIYTNTTDTVKIFLRGHSSPGATSCNTAFDNTGGVTVVIDDVKCIREVGSIGDGYVGNYAFTLKVSRSSGATTTTCTLLGWNNDVEMAATKEDKLAACVPCTQMRDLYSDFRDTLAVYQVRGVDHPYYEQMLRSFMNHKLGKRFATDQYLRFIESCQFADSMLLRRYAGYATLLFTSDNAADAFINHMNNITPGVQIDNFYREQYSPSGFTLMFNLHNVPKEKLYQYKYDLENYTGPVQRFVNWRFDSIATVSGRIGFLYTPDSAYFTPVWADILDTLTNPSSAVYYDTTLIAAPTSSLFKVGGVYEPHKVYYLLHNDLPPIVRSLVTHKINQYILDKGLATTFIQHYQSTVDEDYGKPEKTNLLHYVYGLHHLPPGEVLDSMQEYSLNNRVYFPMSTAVTYDNPTLPKNATHLYVADVAQSYFTKVNTMLQNVATANSGRITLPANLDSLRVNTATDSTTAFRCSDGSYWYRHFIAATDTMFNVFFRLPKYVSKHRHGDFLPIFSTLAPAPGDSLSRNFVIKVRDTKLNSVGSYDTITVKGRTDFVVSKNLTLEDVVLGNPIDGKITLADTFNHCERVRLSAAIYEGRWRHAQYIDSVREFLANDFYVYAMNGIFEALHLGYMDQRFQKVVYYYDRAGNLLKTVPPAGVVNLSSTQSILKKVDTLRKTEASLSQPGHGKASIYNYNSRNQLVKQTTPDAGTTLFWYDAAGRLTFSQNAKQLAKGNYTYNLYDNQSRIIETGQVRLGCAGFNEYTVPIANTVSLPCFFIRDAPVPTQKIVTPHPPLVTTDLTTYSNEQIIAIIRQKNREDVVLTVYDTVAKNLASQPGLSAQENLRKRVSAVKYFIRLAPVDTNFQNYSHTSYYSYDAVGNVKTLTHDFPMLDAYRQRYKRIDYDYDVISGKVNLLSYNRGFSDQFYQRYSYDDDNRITKVETSPDGSIWKRDAEYDYYQHGPLARMSLGDLRVQGVDYAYTIQGWLKAINSDIMTPEADMGKDALDTNSVHGNDAFALTLDYFDGDYKPIGLDSFNHLNHTGKDLYNGNIARQTVGILPFDRLETDYYYDQLHRIKYAYYQEIDPINKTMTPIDDYRSNYKYDLDGNITKLKRFGNDPVSNSIAGTAERMDSLDYFYANAVRPNRLTNVTDRATTTAFGNDIQPFTTTNATRFVYDEIGNLTKDLMNNQDDIFWNLYNKVTRTNNTAAKTGIDFYYDGAGNRAAKVVTKQLDSSFAEDNDYYVRDAQGNILAVYKAESEYAIDILDIVGEIRDEIISGPGGPIPYVDTFIRHWIDGVFDAGFLEKALINEPAWVQDKVDSFAVSYYLQRGELENMLQGTEDYVELLAAYNKDQEMNILESSWTTMFTEADPLKLYNWTASLFGVGSNTTKRDILELICPDANGLATINILRAAVGMEEEPSNCATAVSGLVSNMEENISLLAEGFKTAFDTYPATMNSLFHEISYFDDVIANADYIGSGAPFASVLQQTLHHAEGQAMEDLMGFFDQWVDARDELYTVSTTHDLNSILYYENGQTPYLINYSAANGYQLLDTLVVSSPGFYFGNYFKIIKTLIDPAMLGDAEHIYNQAMVNISRRVWLAEHHIYGSSRLGIKHYWKNHRYNAWDYSQSQIDPAVDSATLQTRLPWFSAEYNDLIRFASLIPYGNTQTTPFSVQHTLGLKGYELNNHLGNVQAVVIDKRQGADLNDDDTIDRYRPSLMAAYDYYPFGMLMPGRYVSDTTSQCAWISQVRLTPQWTYVAIWEDWLNHTFTAFSGGDITILNSGTPDAELQLTAPNPSSYMRTTTTTSPDAEEDMLIPVTHIQGTFIITIEGSENGSSWETITTREVDAVEDQRIMFNTGSSNHLRFTVSRTSEGDLARIRVKPWRRWRLTYAPKDTLVYVCNFGEDKYRFGFNGQEKDNEIKGVGNSINYKERFQDTRLGRFFAVDPLTSKYPYLSSYQFAGNNPIKFIDRDGLEPAENPATLQQRNPTDYGHGRMFLTTATDIQTQKPKEFWVFQRELPKMQGHEYSYYTGSGGAAGWSVFWNDASNSKMRMQATEQFLKATQVVFTTALTLPFGGVGVGLNGTARLSSMAFDAGGQYLTNGRSFGRLNLTSIGASGLLMNPIASESIGQGFSYSFDEGFKQSYVFGDMSNSEFTSNVGIAGGVGLTFKALDNVIGTSGGQQSAFGVKRDLMTLGKRGAAATIATGNAASGVGQSATTNAIQEAVKDDKP